MLFDGLALELEVYFFFGEFAEDAPQNAPCFALPGLAGFLR